MNFTTRIRLPWLAAACLLLPGNAAFGQAVYGSIFGTVTDASGAVIPNATIVVTDEVKGNLGHPHLERQWRIYRRASHSRHLRRESNRPNFQAF